MTASGDAGAPPSGDGGAPVTGDAGAPAAAAPLPPIRLREIPAPGFPIDRPQNGPTIDAPTFGVLPTVDGRIPLATARVEDLIHELRERYTIIIVTHSMQQAARVSQRTAFFLLGELVEVYETEKIFTRPADRRTEDYITGKFG